MRTPILDRVVVIPFTEEENTESAYYSPTDSKTNNGEVVSVGVMVNEVKVGDKVTFGKHSGIPIDFDGKEALIMPEREILLH